ncbi:peptidase domain-containing ABC transporter [Streptococcus pluranimalium]|nr:peptide cleavage/export ABC transporter [Streptococcus suis]
MKDKFKLIAQMDQMDCGVTCIQMILRYYNSNLSIRRLREITGTDRNGVSALGIRNAFIYLGFDSTVISADKSIWEYNQLVYPLIVNTINSNGELHYVVVYKKSRGNLYIADPIGSKRIASIEEFSNECTGVMVLIEAGKNFVPFIEEVRGITAFLPILYEMKIKIISIIILSLLITMISVGSTFYFQITIDKLIPYENIGLLNIISFVLFISYIIRTLVELLKDNLLVDLGLKMNKKIISDYFHHIIRLPLSFYSSRSSGDIISRFFDASRIVDSLATAIITIVVDLLMVIVSGLSLFLQNKTLFLISVISLPIYTVIILYFSKKFENMNNQQLAASSLLNSKIIESINGIENIKSYQKERYFYTEITKKLDNYLDLIKKNGKLTNFQYTLKILTEFAFSTVVVWIGSIYVIQSKLTLGELIAFNTLLVFFTSPIQNIVNLQVQLQSAEIASKRLNEILTIKEEKYNENNLNWNEFKKSILVKNLNFSYDQKNMVLKNICLEIYKGKKLAIMGMSGSGKSTLGKVLVNFYDINSDNIFFDDFSIRDISIEDIRGMISYVPQEPFLISGTIMDNLLLDSNNSVDIKMIESTCSKAGILDFIIELPLGFETKVEENGANLSGGQKKRIELARALLSNKPIIIFDEITAGIDFMQEIEIMESLIKESQKTFVFITHSLNVSRFCDEILFIESGQIIERGNFHNLINRDSRYKQLWEKFINIG